LVREAMMGPRILTPSRIHYKNECSPLQVADYVGERGNNGPQNTDTIKNTFR
jgi:hypothetical protein